MFTIIGAMAELESSLISERVTAGMKAAEARGKQLGRPATSKRVVRFRGRSQAGRAAALSERSPNAPGTSSRRPCDHFLHVSRTYRRPPAPWIVMTSRACRSPSAPVSTNLKIQATRPLSPPTKGATMSSRRAHPRLAAVPMPRLKHAAGRAFVRENHAPWFG
jgi:hypothetical protein